MSTAPSHQVSHSSLCYFILFFMFYLLFVVLKFISFSTNVIFVLDSHMS